MQARSRRTLDRILDATEALLGDRTFEDLTIAEVLKRAGASVGAFYARFSGKEALLDAIYDRHQRQVQDAMKAALDPAAWADRPVAQIVEVLVHQTVRLYRDHRGLLRTLVLRGHAKPDWRYAEPNEREGLVISKVGALLAARKSEIKHPDPASAARLGFLMVVATVREKVLFGDSTASAVELSDAQLETELARAFLAYLCVVSSETARSAPTTAKPSAPRRADDDQGSLTKHYGEQE